MLRHRLSAVMLSELLTSYGSSFQQPALNDRRKERVKIERRISMYRLYVVQIAKIVCYVGSDCRWHK